MAAENGNNKSESAKQRILDLVIDRGIPAIAGAIGLVTFVAIVGAAVVWVRLDAAELPTNEIIPVLPNDRLVPLGAGSIIGFLLLGTAATFLVYGFDASTPRQRNTTGSPGPKGRITLGAASGIILLVGAELLAALWSFDAGWSWGAISATVLVLMGVGAGLAYIQAARSTVQGRGTKRIEAARPDPAEESEYRYLEWPPNESRHKWGPVRFRFAARWWALIAIGCVVVSSCIAGWKVYESAGYAVLLLVVVLILAFACLGAARGDSFFWVGMCVFVTAGLFGAVVTFIRTERTPKVEPAALLRLNGAPVCALFVAEADDRVYLARNTALKGDRAHAVAGSGYLFSLPNKNVGARSVGSLVGIGDARERSANLLTALMKDYPSLAEAARGKREGWCKK